MHAKLIVKLTRRDLANELLSVLKEYKELGIAKQIDYQKFYLDSVISNSAALSDLYPDPIAPEMVDNCTKEPSEAERMADILDFVADGHYSETLSATTNRVWLSESSWWQ